MLRMHLSQMIGRILVLAIFFLLAACDSLTRISGRVIDEQGRPISKARVWLIFGNWVDSTETDENGAYAIARVHGGSENLTLLVSKNGKRLFYESVDHSVQRQNLDVILKDGSQMMLDTPNTGDTTRDVPSRQ